MKISKKMSVGEFAALVASHLQSKGISTVLTGGAVVSIYTENKYMSYDADFISPADQKIINKAMQELGFEKHGKDFSHKQTDFFVEFPSGPLAIGDQLVQAEAELNIKGHKLKLLSPTQSVMDRLAAYFHWNDLQCLDQAVWIAMKQPVQIYKIKEWAKREDEESKFNVFLNNLKNNQC
jgi:hypothetical protein